MTGGQPLNYVIDGSESVTLRDVLERRAQASAGERFVTFEGRDVSFGEALERAQRCAAGLAHAGVAKGDKVAVMLPNCLEFLDLWFGAAVLGAILVPVNTGLRGEGLRYIVEHSDAAVVVVDEPLVDVYEGVLPGGAGPRARHVRGGSRDGWQSVEELLSGAEGAPPRPGLAPDEVTCILYTSGTTGLPKGVMNCHNAYATAGLEFTRNAVRARGDDVFYTTLPLFHVNAQMLTTMGALVSGRPMVLAPRFSASGFMDDVRAHGATVFNYIGAMLTMIYKQPERADDAENPARLTVGGAAPAELWSAFEARFGLTILELYGLTETATFCLANPAGDIRLGKIGRPVSWSEVRVESEPGVEAPVGTPGEIAIRATRPDVLFKGYYKNDEATRAAMEGGWFHSGDRGRQDEDGYFVFLDRLKDAIRRRGENISSYEVERVVNTHPSIAESAAVGVPSDLGEEEVMIVVVPQAGETVDPAELVAYCAERMARFMVPRYVLVRDGLPKTATERVQKFKLREEGFAAAWDALMEVERT